MKIRDGFVSNSSSTSFIIVTKKPLTKETLLEKLSFHFKIIQGTWMYHKILSKAVEIFFDGIDEEYIKDTVYNSRYGEEGFEYIYRGETTVLNQDDWAGIDDPVINTDINIYNDDFIMHSDEYY